jgi:RHS repeat-associated protein
LSRFARPVIGLCSGLNDPAPEINRDTTRSQAFTYDSLNRISTAQTTSTFSNSPANCWGESFQYDQWANLLSIGASSSAYTGCTQQSLSLGMNVNGSNQISSPTGYVYDADGNLTTVPSPGAASYTYNAENKMTSTAGLTYTYDGDGQRVEKSNGKLYWYGSGGQVLDETDLSGNLISEYVFFGGKRISRRDSPSNNIFYYFEDHLGTSREIVESGQTSSCYDADFYPFGGERTPIVNTCPQNYKFTGKERDSESGLDNFEARYNSSSIGRFMSPDPLGLVALPGDAHDPQSWNAYSYVRNNALNLTDPDGTLFCRPATAEEQKSGAGQICITDTEYINGGDKFRNQGYQHYDCSCDTAADRAAYNRYISGTTADVTADYFFRFPAIFSGARVVYGLSRLALSGVADFLLGGVEEEETLVIGKMNPDGTLRDGTLGDGEHTLDLPKQDTPKANWAQNSSNLRQAISDGKPIRDASVGNPGSNTGFLRAERNLLQDHGWTLEGDYWVPPNK